MIILAVQGSGKSYAAAQRDDVADIDRIRGKEAVADYVDRLQKADHVYPYTCGNARLDIAEELVKRQQDFVIFAPFREILSEEVYQEMKERLFGRLVLRKEQNARTCQYIESFKKHYDEFNSTMYYKEVVKEANSFGKPPVDVHFFVMNRDQNSVCELLNAIEEANKEETEG